MDAFVNWQQLINWC